MMMMMIQSTTYNISLPNPNIWPTVHTSNFMMMIRWNLHIHTYPYTFVYDDDDDDDDDDDADEEDNEDDD